MEQKKETPYRIVIEQDGKVFFDMQATTFCGVINDGESGTRFAHFRKSSFAEVVNALSHLRTIESDVLNEYPEALRQRLYLLLAKIKPRKVGEADETDEEDSEIPLFKLKDYKEDN